MLETEAKTKWCPFARVPQDYNVSYGETQLMVVAVNRSGEGLPIGECIGSKCMAWRSDHTEGNGHGYCGLAVRGGE